MSDYNRNYELKKVKLFCNLKFWLIKDALKMASGGGFIVFIYS